MPDSDSFWRLAIRQELAHSTSTRMTKMGNCWIRSTQTIVSGRNTVQVYDYYEENTLFVVYNLFVDQPKADQEPLLHERHFHARQSLYVGLLQRGGYVQQVNSGGLNVKFVNWHCSMDKFICENLPLFQYACLIALVLIQWKRGSHRANKPDQRF